ncbi:uncharacterized protein LOC121369102 [Gigantopelta aegis]|uniref:uncharacterized protein LOC121369102 n=1 Tax=Gigantopelta aegis TaxID=1735272 RepID=UPI001B88D013|nr:uncharacterized protein LOC121369102 [Gigantopelta aegis]
MRKCVNPAVMLCQGSTAQVDDSVEKGCENNTNLMDLQDDFQNAALAAYFDYLYLLTTKPAVEKILSLKNLRKKQTHRRRGSQGNTNLNLVSGPSEIITSDRGQQKAKNGSFCEISQLFVTGVQMERFVDNVHTSVYTSEAVALVNASEAGACVNTSKPDARVNTSEAVVADADLVGTSDANNQTVTSSKSDKISASHNSVSADACEVANNRNLTIRDVTMSPRTKNHNEKLLSRIFNRLYDSLSDLEPGEHVDDSFDHICDQSCNGSSVTLRLKKPRRKLRKLSDCLSDSFSACSYGLSGCASYERGSVDASACGKKGLWSDSSAICCKDNFECNKETTQFSSREDEASLSSVGKPKWQSSRKRQCDKDTVEHSPEKMSNKASVCVECEQAHVNKAEQAHVNKAKQAPVDGDQPLTRQAIKNLNACNDQNNKVCSECKKHIEDGSVLLGNLNKETSAQEFILSQGCTSHVLSSGDKRQPGYSTVMLDQGDDTKGDNSMVSDSKGEDSVFPYSKRENSVFPDFKGDNSMFPDSKEENERKAVRDAQMDDDADSTCSGVAGSSDTEKLYDVTSHLARGIRLRSGTKVLPVINPKYQQYYRLITEFSKQSEKNTRVKKDEERKVQKCLRFKRKRHLDWFDRKASKRRRHLQVNHGENRDTSFSKVKSRKKVLITNSLMSGSKRGDNWRKTKQKILNRQKNFEYITKRNFKNISKSHKRKVKVASSKRTSPKWPKRTEKICEERSILKCHEAVRTSPIPSDPFSHLCQLERKAVDIGVGDMEKLLSSKPQNGQDSTVLFSVQHKLVQWHPGGIWQTIVTDK